MRSPSPKNLKLGKGSIFFDRFDAEGNSTGEVHLGNCSALTIGTADQKITKYSSMDAEAGVLREATTRRDVTAKITGDEFNAFNAALFMMGQESPITQSAGSVTEQVLTEHARLGRWYPVGKRNISAVTVTKGVTPLVAGTDYTVDAVRGRIYLRPESATIVEADELEVAYTAAAIAALSRVKGATAAQIEGRLRFVGDPSAGPVDEVEIWRCSVQPEGETGYISDDWGNWALTLKLLKDETRPDNPWYERIETGNV